MNSFRLHNVRIATSQRVYIVCTDPGEYRFNIGTPYGADPEVVLSNLLTHLRREYRNVDVQVLGVAS